MTETARNRWIVTAAIISMFLQTLTFVSLAFGGVLRLNSRLTAVESKLELLLDAHKMISR